MNDDAKTASSISDSELDILKALWNEHPLKVGDVRERLNTSGRSWAYNTVQTLLNRLEAKGFVNSQKAGRAYVFSPAISQNQFLDNRLTDLAEKICEGSQTPLMMALVQKQKFTRSEIDEFRQMLDRLEEEEE